MSQEILIGIDAGTSVIKAVAFDLRGDQIAEASVLNRYHSAPDGEVIQPMNRTWDDCATALRALGGKVDDLPGRTAAVAVTGQGDGTWLMDADGAPVCDAWLWLDARAAPTVRRLAQGPRDRARFEATGTGLNTCQMGAQMAHMDTHHPHLLDRAASALHCKDWLYFRLTGERATDPSEACFTFGDFRTRDYDDGVIDALGLSHRRHLLPPIVDGWRTTHPLSGGAATATGLRAGTPVTLGYVDMVMTALGAGVHTGEDRAACSTIGSTGVHMRSAADTDVVLNDARTGYVICLPLPGRVSQVQTNMAATLNIDWALRLAADLMSETGHPHDYADLVKRIDGWMAAAAPGSILYHPYISEAGERGPFVDADARAGFIGLAAHHRFADLMRGVVEGLGLATRDCYAAMGDMPRELRITGGASRSAALRQVLAAATGAHVRVSSRGEAGAAGAAMMAAVANGVYADMDTCIADWVTPHLNTPEPPDPGLREVYDGLFPAYRQAREALSPVWGALATRRTESAELAEAKPELTMDAAAHEGV